MKDELLSLVDVGATRVFWEVRLEWDLGSTALSTVFRRVNIYLKQLFLEFINFSQKEDDGGPREQSRVNDRVEQDDALRHSALVYAGHTTNLSAESKWKTEKMRTCPWPSNSI